MRMLRVTLAFVVLCSLCTLNVKTAQAQTEIEFGPGVGYDFDVEELFLTGFFAFKLADVGDNMVLRGAPSFDYFLVDPGSLWSLNGELELVFKLEDSPIAPFVGGGLSYSRFSVGTGSFSISNSDIHLILRGGIQTVQTGNIVLDPHLYIRIGDGSSIGVGTRVRFGNAGRNSR